MRIEYRLINPKDMPTVEHIPSNMEFICKVHSVSYLSDRLVVWIEYLRISEVENSG